jgi:hypothetical protein
VVEFKRAVLENGRFEEEWEIHSGAADTAQWRIDNQEAAPRSLSIGAHRYTIIDHSFGVFEDTDMRNASCSAWSSSDQARESWTWLGARADWERRQWLESHLICTEDATRWRLLELLEEDEEEDDDATSWCVPPWREQPLHVNGSTSDLELACARIFNASACEQRPANLELLRAVNCTTDARCERQRADMLIWQTCLPCMESIQRSVVSAQLEPWWRLARLFVPTQTLDHALVFAE